MGEGTRVLILEQQEVVRQGVAAMLGAIAEVGEWSCLDSMDELTSVARHGDVALISVAAIDEDDLDTITLPACLRSIVLVPSDDPYQLEAATAIHANGYLLMDTINVPGLRTALLQVRHDVMPLPREVSSFLLKRARGDDPLSLWRSVRLTPREREVLELLIEGRSNQQIASGLCISIHGAKRHVSSILNKLGSPSRAHLVSTALQSGIVRRSAWPRSNDY